MDITFNTADVRPSYTFTAYNEINREFHHRWHTGRGKFYDCETCYNLCHRGQPYAKHYEVNTKHNALVLTPEQKEILQIMDSNNIDTLLMSNENENKENLEFLLDAAVEVVPSLVRLLFVKAEKVYIVSTFDVKIDKFDFIFESTELAIEHHFDIDESTDMVFMMLLEKIKMLMCSLGYIDIDDFKIQRIKVQLRMEQGAEDGSKRMSLPIKYRVKNAAYEINEEQLKEEHETKKSCDIDAVTAAYKKYKESGKAEDLMKIQNANLYCFQICRTSLEVYIVPYHISAQDDDKDNRNFIILDDVQGNFQNMMEITNLHRFTRIENPLESIACTKCNTNYTELPKLQIHQTLDCGDSFEIYETDGEEIDEYPDRIKIDTIYEKWLLFGIKN